MRAGDYGFLIASGLLGCSSGPAESQAAEMPIQLPRMPAPGDEVVLTGPVGGPLKAELRGQALPNVLPPLPVGSDLLPLAAPQAFGSDGRCSVTGAPKRFVLRCRPGTSTSGAVLAFPGSRLPAGGRLQLSVASSGSGGFSAALTKLGADANRVFALRAGIALDPLPALGEEPAQLVILAPPEGGELTIAELQIVADPAVEPVRKLSAWSWAPATWRNSPEATLRKAKHLGLSRLFVTLDIVDGRLRGGPALASFVRLATAAGIAIEAVEGDPRMVLPEGRAAAILRARAFAGYQSGAAADERLGGIQYDVEPYVLSEWGNAGADHDAWGAAILALAEAAEARVDLVLPFWVANEPEGRRLLETVAPAVRGVTVMSYRTSRGELTQVAEPLLAWGAAKGVPVRLGLEAERLHDEQEEVFRRADTGTLAIFPGARPRLLIPDRPGTVAGAQMYRSSGRSRIAAARISFLGEERRMLDMAAGTSGLFSAWPSFSGFALHGLDWTD
jgi:hypothetical protein